MGDWRSWLARLTGSQKVTGSNPVFSTFRFRHLQGFVGAFHFVIYLQNYQHFYNQ